MAAFEDALVMAAAASLLEIPTEAGAPFAVGVEHDEPLELFVFVVGPG